MQTITQELSNNSLKSFSFQVSENTPQFLMDGFVNWLSNYIADGAEFEDGHTLEFGWSQILCKVDDQKLSLMAPNYKDMPIKWTTDLSSIFHIMMEHKYIPESFDEEQQAVNLLQTAIIGPDFAEEPMFIERIEPSSQNDRDSGWFIGSLKPEIDNDTPKNLKLISLYEAVLKAPQILSFLSLPKNFRIGFKDGEVQFTKNLELIQPQKNSYLTKKSDNNS
jgi:hypothetical protein